MKIKYNEFGEVISVNGLTTGQHLGTPLQDALGTPEDNAPYCEERCTVTRCYNTCDDMQPVPSGGNIQPLEVTENGTYPAEGGVTGFSPVIVNVGGSSSGDEGWIGDGNTHIWITLYEGRTSPMLGVCPNGTVTVDWGDGTTPDVLTGTSVATVKWTPTHEYAEPGDYVITLTVDGEMGFYGYFSANTHSGILRYSSAVDTRNKVYQNAVQKIECGSGVTSIGSSAFQNCGSLASITIPDSVTSIGDSAFYDCGSLASITIPDSVTSIGDSAFKTCYSLASITIPDSVTSIGSNAFYYCRGVAFYDFTSHTAIPTLSATDAFTSIASDCEIRVPVALYDEWIAETNWATYASQIVVKGVSA